MPPGRNTMDTNDLENQGHGEACLDYHEPKKQFVLKRFSPSRRALTNMGSDWMAFLGDNTPLSMLTIPGTHDSAAFTNSYPFIATQKMNTLRQMNAGIRYFDLRCGLRKDIVEMVHGPSYLGLTLLSVLETMYAWLTDNPSEAIIVQIKRDRQEDRCTMDFTEAVVAVLAQRSDRWRTENTVPLLGELRGRIQLFRRFEGINAYGLNVTDWKDNPLRPFTIFARHNIRVTIQDHYTFLDPKPLPVAIRNKGGVVRRMMNRASSNNDPSHWFINFTSAYEFNLRYQLTPREIAVGGWYHFGWEEGINLRVRAFLLERGGRKERLGIVAMDFPEIGTDDLIAALIQTNFDLEERRPWYRLNRLLSVLIFCALLTWIWVVVQVAQLRTWRAVSERLHHIVREPAQQIILPTYDP